MDYEVRELNLPYINSEVVGNDDTSDAMQFEINSSDYCINVAYANDNGTLYLENGEYIIPVNGQTLFLQGDKQQYVLEDLDNEIKTEVVEHPIDNNYELIELLETTTDANNESTDENASSQIQFISNSDNLDELEQDEEVALQPQYQFAILRNGKLHLQSLNVMGEDLQVIQDNDHQQELEDQLAALQQSISLDDTLQTATIDLEKITGRNLITGQTVTLDGYFEKLQKHIHTIDLTTPPSTCKGSREQNKRKQAESEDIINKKFMVGKTSKGKKIVGKIVHIQTNTDKDDSLETSNNKTEETSIQPQIIIKKHIITRESFDHIRKTLSGLMKFESVNHRLLNKDLVVKVVDKKYDHEISGFKRSASFVYGKMKLVEDNNEIFDEKWEFILNSENSKDDLPEKDAVNAIVTDDYENSNVHMSLKLKGSENDVKDTVSLSVINTIDANGTRSTKVNLAPPTFEHCHLCDKVFKTSALLKRHISVSHYSGKETDSYACEYCEKLFSNQKFLQRHMKIHTKDKRWYQCLKCPKAFNTARSLKRHFTVHDPSLRPLECTLCTQRFTDESSLRKHLLIHTGIRAYACNVCNRSFVYQGDLNYHRRIHDPVKQFSCEVCGREFSRHTNLLRHTEIHKGSGELYRCDLCGCSYGFVSSLTRHIVQKHIK